MASRSTRTSWSEPPSARRRPETRSGRPTARPSSTSPSPAPASRWGPSRRWRSTPIASSRWSASSATRSGLSIEAAARRRSTPSLGRSSRAISTASGAHAASEAVARRRRAAAGGGRGGREGAWLRSHRTRASSGRTARWTRSLRPAMPRRADRRVSDAPAPCRSRPGGRAEGAARARRSARGDGLRAGPDGRDEGRGGRPVARARAHPPGERHGRRSAASGAGPRQAARSALGCQRCFSKTASVGVSKSASVWFDMTFCATISTTSSTARSP